jgi:hypothetical protein
MSIFLCVLGFWLLLGYLSVLWGNKVIDAGDGGTESLRACLFLTAFGVVTFIAVLLMSFTGDYPLKSWIIKWAKKILYKVYFLKN